MSSFGLNIPTYVVSLPTVQCSILFTSFQQNSGLKILQFQELQKGASEGHQDKIISINSTQIIFLHEQCANSNSKKLAFEAFASYFGAKIKSTGVYE